MERRLEIEQGVLSERTSTADPQTSLGQPMPPAAPVQAAGTPGKP
jgi:hypothetical protein